MPFAPSRRTLVEIFEYSVERFASRPLFGTKREDRWEWLEYGAFGSMVDRFRGGLASLEVRSGDPIAIVSNNRPEWAVVAYAGYTLGAVVVPMYEAQNPREWEFIVRDCRARVLVIASDVLLSRAADLLASVRTIEHVVVIDPTAGGDPRIRPYRLLLEAALEAPRVRPAPSDTAGLIYTSGTTGTPKGVVLTHSNIASNLGALQEIVPNDDDDRSLSILPWAHVFGQTVELHGLLSIGGSMAISRGIHAIVDELRQVRPTVLIGVPRVFNEVYASVHRRLEAGPAVLRRMVADALRISEKRSRGGSPSLRERALLWLVDKVVFAKVRAAFGGRLRHAISGGAALSKEVAYFMDALGIDVYEGYGLTETSPVVATNVPGARKLGSVGRPIPGVRVEIHPAGAEERSRREGEIVVYGDNVMSGYLDRPEETEAAFSPQGGLRTGDIGYLDAEGFLYVTGRLKEQYKLENGKYVVPGLLEETLKLSPFVANVMVYGENRPYNVAVVVPRLDAVRRWAEKQGLRMPTTTEALLSDGRVRSLFEGEIAQCAAAARGFEKIRDFLLVPEDFTTENGMLTASMKVKRRAVLDAFRRSIDALYEKRAPATAPPA